MPWRYHQGQRKQSQLLLTIFRNGTQKRLWHHCRSLWKHKSADFPPKVDNIWHESSSQTNEYNEVTISNRKEYTGCRILRSHSGVIQVHQTIRYVRYGNPQYDSTRWSWSYCPPKLLRMIEWLNSSSKTTISGSRHLKILEKSKITPEYKHEASRN